jgi:cysteine desulfurase / selenocysteine lyase
VSGLSLIRDDFPILARAVGGRPLVYFDNAATALKPKPVVEAVVRYMCHYTANIHRGKHLLSEEASEAYEASRTRVAEFINASSREVIFVRGATEGINLVAAGLGLERGANVVGSVLEHHSNILPWTSRCAFRGASLLGSGLPDLAAAESLIDEKTRLVTVTQCSNVTGVVVPVEQWVAMAHRHGLPILVDASQYAPHRRLDVQRLGCDYMVFSGHKMLGPTGAGVLYGRQEALERLAPPWLGGGAVSLVRADFTYDLRELPWRLEAGTPDIAAVIGLGAAVEYLSAVGMEALEEHDRRMVAALDAQLGDLEGLRCFRPDPTLPRIGLLAFTEATGMLAPDYLSRVLSDTFGVMLRAGHHCAHPLHAQIGVGGTLRASLYLYNTEEEIARLREALVSILRMVPRK